MHRPETLSVVTTLFNSRPYVIEFYERIWASAKKCGFQGVEVVFVDDCCPQNSHEIVRKICVKNSSVKLIKLAANAGHHHAMMCGLNATKGDLVFLIDVDLEEEPEYLAEFVQKYDVKRPDVVFGVQIKRKGSISEQFFGWLHWKVLKSLSPNTVADLSVMRLQTQRYVRALVNHWNANFVLSLSTHAIGFKQATIQIDKKDTSPTTYTNLIKIKQSIDSVVLANSRVFDIFVLVSGAVVVFGMVMVLASLAAWLLSLVAGPSMFFATLAMLLIGFLFLIFSIILKYLVKCMSISIE